MSNLIDVEKLIKDIQKLNRSYTPKENGHYSSKDAFEMNGILKARNLINKQPVVNQWNSISVNPPKKEKTYLIQTHNGYMCLCRWTNQNIFLPQKVGSWHWNVFDVPQYSKIVAWMEKPEPFKD